MSPKAFALATTLVVTVYAQLSPAAGQVLVTGECLSILDQAATSSLGHASDPIAEELGLEPTEIRNAFRFFHEFDANAERFGPPQGDTGCFKMTAAPLRLQTAPSVVSEILLDIYAFFETETRPLVPDGLEIGTIYPPQTTSSRGRILADERFHDWRLGLRGMDRRSRAGTGVSNDREASTAEVRRYIRWTQPLYGSKADYAIVLCEAPCDDVVAQNSVAPQPRTTAPTESVARQHAPESEALGSSTSSGPTSDERPGNAPESASIPLSPIDQDFEVRFVDTDTGEEVADVALSAGHCRIEADDPSALINAYFSTRCQTLDASRDWRIERIARLPDRPGLGVQIQVDLKSLRERYFKGLEVKATMTDGGAPLRHCALRATFTSRDPTTRGRLDAFHDRPIVLYRNPELPGFDTLNNPDIETLGTSRIPWRQLRVTVSAVPEAACRLPSDQRVYEGDDLEADRDGIVRIDAPNLQPTLPNMAIFLASFLGTPDEYQGQGRSVTDRYPWLSAQDQREDLEDFVRVALQSLKDRAFRVRVFGVDRNQLVKQLFEGRAESIGDIRKIVRRISGQITTHHADYADTQFQAEIPPEVDELARDGTATYAVLFGRSGYAHDQSYCDGKPVAFSPPNRLFLIDYADAQNAVETESGGDAKHPLVGDFRAYVARRCTGAGSPHWVVLPDYSRRPTVNDERPKLFDQFFDEISRTVPEPLEP